MDTVHLNLLRLIQFRVQYFFFKLRTVCKGASEPLDAVRSRRLESMSEESEKVGATAGGAPATTTNDDGKGDVVGDPVEEMGESKGAVELSVVLSSRSSPTDAPAPPTAHRPPPTAHRPPPTARALRAVLVRVSPLRASSLR